MTQRQKYFSEWRAEKLGYVYFSRLDNLIIKDIDDLPGDLFDYLIDIGEKKKQTGRFFVVEVKAIDVPDRKKHLSKEYKNISMPALLVLFDNRNDRGYFKWIKKPLSDGGLIFDSRKRDDVEILDNKSLARIVTEVKQWYSARATA